MLRILRSTLSVAASASSATVNADITQADLEAAVPVGGSILPLAFVLDPEDADVTISSLVIGNTKNEEGKVNMVPLGAALSLSALNKVLSMESGGVDAPRLSVAHGARLTAVVSNAVASPKTISILWKVENAFLGLSGGNNAQLNPVSVNAIPDNVLLQRVISQGRNSVQFRGPGISGRLPAPAQGII